MSLAKKAGQAGALMLFRKGWGAIVNIGVMAFLARTLNKSDFGLVAISGTLIAMIQTIGVAGISEYIVFYNGDDAREKQNGAFWLNALLTLLVAIAILITVPFWADFYKDERIVKLVYLLLIGFVFTMFSSIPLAIFRKKLEFKTMIKTQTIFGTLSQVSQIAFVYLGFGVYSLAMPSAVIIPIMTVVLFKQSGYKINFTDFGTKQWKEITKYTKHVVGSRVLTKLVNEGDTLLVGKLLGMEALGVYDIAFKLANIFNQNLLPIITNISMPVFALNQTDKNKVREYYNKMISVISFVFIPIMFWLLLNAKFVILKLYGSQWEAAVLPAQIFMLFALFRSISSPTSGLYNALGKPQISLYFSIAYAPFFFLFLFYFSKFGLINTCIAVSALRIAGSMFHFFMGNYLLENRIKSFINLFYPILASVLIVVLLILYFKIENVFLSSFIYLVGVGLILILFFRNYLQNNIFQIAQSLRLNTSNGKQ